MDHKIIDFPYFIDYIVNTPLLLCKRILYIYAKISSRNQINNDHNSNQTGDCRELISALGLAQMAWNPNV